MDGWRDGWMDVRTDGWMDRLTDWRTDGWTEIAGRFGPKTFWTFDTFQTQDDSDPSSRRFGPNTEDVSDPAFRPCPVIINNFLVSFPGILLYNLYILIGMPEIWQIWILINFNKNYICSFGKTRATIPIFFRAETHIYNFFALVVC